MAEKNKLLLIMVFATLLAACGYVPGYVHEARSGYDGSVKLSMVPAFVYRYDDGFSGSDIKMSLSWDSGMRPGEVILEVYVYDVYDIRKSESLYFMVDGEEQVFSSYSLTPHKTIEPGSRYGSINVPDSTVVSRRYRITTDFIDKIISANDVRVKVELIKTREYSDQVWGVFSDSTFNSARNAFVKFRKKMVSNGQL